MPKVNGFKLDPVVWLYALNSVVALVVSFGLPLSADQTGAITAIATAVLGLIAAFQVRPVDVPAIKALLSGALIAGGAFGLHLGANQIGELTVVVGIVVSLLLRQAVTPNASKAPVGQPAHL